MPQPIVKSLNWIWVASALLVGSVMIIGKLSIDRHDGALLGAIREHDVQAAQQAFKDGATMKTGIKYNWTYLQAAAYQGQVEMAKLLVEHGAAMTLTATNDSGQTALDVAVANHHPEMADYLQSLIKTNDVVHAP